MKLFHILGLLRITTSTASYFKNTSKKCLNIFTRGAGTCQTYKKVFLQKIAVLLKAVKLFSQKNLNNRCLTGA